MTPKVLLLKYSNLILLGLIIAFGLHLRLTAVLETEVIHPIRADAREYILYAYNLNQFGIYSRSTEGFNGDSVPLPDSARPPGYPLFINLFIGKNGMDNDVLNNLLLGQAFLGTLVILLSYLLFVNSLGKTTALLIAGLTAISPHLVNINLYYLSESLFTLLILLLFYLFFQLEKYRHKTSLIILTGIVLAYASLTRPWLQYFVFFLLPFYYLSHNHSARLQKTIIFAGAFMFLWIAWLLRNHLSVTQASDSSVMISSILHGLYPNLMYQGDPESFGFPYRYDPNKEAITESLSTLLTEIIRRFHSQPWEHLQWYLFGKPIFLFSWQYVQGVGESFIYPVKTTPYYYYSHFQMTHAMMKNLHGGLMVLAGLGCISTWTPIAKKYLKPHALILFQAISLLVIYFTLIHLLVAPLSRYAVPIRPLMYGMAFVPLVLLFKWIAHNHLLKHFFSRRIKK